MDISSKLKEKKYKDIFFDLDKDSSTKESKNSAITKD